MRRRLLLIIAFLSLGNFFYGQSSYKDVRYTYLWDVTLSMKGYNHTPNIYDKVVEVMIKDIQLIDNERAEIVVIPFQETQYCEVWREYATNIGKKTLIQKITTYNNSEITYTNISAPLQYTIDSIFTSDRIDVMKLLTDGFDNVNPVRLYQILTNWCEIAKNKDAYGYYILLTDSALNGDLSIKLKEICNFEEVDLTKESDYKGVTEIIQETPSFAEGIPINIRDEYDKPKRLEFIQLMGDKVPKGFMIHFKTRDNEFITIDEIVELQPDNSVLIHPRFLKPKDELIQLLPVEYNFSDIILEYEPTDDMCKGEFRFTRLVDNACNIFLVNKPEKTVRIYVKQ